MNARKAMPECRGQGVTHAMAARGSTGGEVATRRTIDAAEPGEKRVDNPDRVLDAVVHAVSNSINSVMASSQMANLLTRQNRLQDVRGTLDRAEEECMRAARLLRDGRDLVRFKVPLEGNADIVTLLTACVAACVDLGEVRVTCAENPPPVRGHAFALKRLFVEVLDNAFQFGAHHIEVTVAADHGKGCARIEIRDDGPGVDVPAATIFEPFVTSEPADHSGLGLAFATRIAATYGGSIRLGESSSGALFRVELPFAMR